MSKITYIGFIWDKFTPAVQARAYRDLLELKALIEKWPDQEMVVVTNQSIDLAGMLNQLQITGSQDPRLAKAWRMYIVEQEPTLPVWAKQVFTADLRPTNSRGKNQTLQLTESHGPVLKDPWVGFTDTNPMERPAPNGWAPVSPGLVAIWS